MLAYFIGAGTMVAVGIGAERMLGSPRAKSTSINVVASVLQISITQGFSASIAPLVIYAGSKIPTPHFHLSGRASLFPFSLLLMLALTDLTDYFFHRLEHRVPWMWRMHSFHHSDSTMNATTAYRAFWLDRILQATFFVPLGLTFHADGNVMLAMTVIYWIMAALEHANLHIGLPSAPWLIVTPQYHRLHHSIQKEHYDRNFSGIFPVWDVLFGTFEEPHGFPPTGLVEGEPSGFKESLSWLFLIRPSLEAERGRESVGSCPSGDQQTESCKSGA